jgi:hypothetical protein
MLVRQPVNLLFAFRRQSPLVVIQRWNSSTRSGNSLPRAARRPDDHPRVLRYLLRTPLAQLLFLGPVRLLGICAGTDSGALVSEVPFQAHASLLMEAHYAVREDFVRIVLMGVI